MLLSIQFHLPFHNMIMQNTAYKPKWFSFSLFLYFTQIITFILQFHNLFQDIKIMQSIEIKHYLCTGFVVIILLCFIYTARRALSAHLFGTLVQYEYKWMHIYNINTQPHYTLSHIHTHTHGQRLAHAMER